MARLHLQGGFDAATVSVVAATSGGKRITFGRGYFNTFITVIVAADKPDTAGRYGKLPGEEAEKMIVGLAVDRRCRDTDFEAAIGLEADDFIAGRARLDADIEQQALGDLAHG